MKKYIRLTLAVLLAFSFIATVTAADSDHQSKPAEPAHHSKANIITIEKKSDGYTWILQTPSKPGVPYAKLSLRDAKDKPVKGLIITGQIWMPEMKMKGYPMDLKFKEEQEGEYGVRLSYAHGGYWQVIAEFKNGKNQIIRQTFDIDILNN